MTGWVVCKGCIPHAAKTPWWTAYWAVTSSCNDSVPRRAIKVTSSGRRETGNTVNIEELISSRSGSCVSRHTLSLRSLLSQTKDRDKRQVVPEQFVLVFLHISRWNVWYDHLHVQLVDHRHLRGQRQRSQQSLKISARNIERHLHPQGADSFNLPTSWLLGEKNSYRLS